MDGAAILVQINFKFDNSTCVTLSAHNPFTLLHIAVLFMIFTIINTLIANQAKLIFVIKKKPYQNEFCGKRNHFTII